MTRLDGRHALVTGASGFVGANLVRALLAAECEVTCLVRPASDRWRLREVEDRVEVRHAELEDIASLAALPDRALSDLIFHAAAEGVRPAVDPVSVIDANVLGTLNLLRVLAERGECARFVFCSSCSVYGPGAGCTEASPLRGNSAYALSKIAGEAICRSYSSAGLLPAVVLRLYTPYGPYESGYRFVAGTMLSALRGRELRLTPGEQTRDFIHVDDVVRAMIASATVPGIEGDIINVCTGHSTRIRDAVELIVGMTGSRSRPVFGAMPYRENEVWEMSGDPGKMHDVLGVPAPIPLRDGLRQTGAWLAQHLDLYE